MTMTADRIPIQITIRPSSGMVETWLDLVPRGEVIGLLALQINNGPLWPLLREFRVDPAGDGVAAMARVPELLGLRLGQKTAVIVMDYDRLDQAAAIRISLEYKGNDITIPLLAAARNHPQPLLIAANSGIILLESVDTGQLPPLTAAGAAPETAPVTNNGAPPEPENDGYFERFANQMRQEFAGPLQCLSENITSLETVFSLLDPAAYSANLQQLLAETATSFHQALRSARESTAAVSLARAISWLELRRQLAAHQDAAQRQAAALSASIARIEPASSKLDESARAVRERFTAVSGKCAETAADFGKLPALRACFDDLTNGLYRDIMDKTGKLLQPKLREGATDTRLRQKVKFESQRSAARDALRRMAAGIGVEDLSDKLLLLAAQLDDVQGPPAPPAQASVPADLTPWLEFCSARLAAAMKSGRCQMESTLTDYLQLIDLSVTSQLRAAGIDPKEQATNAPTPADADQALEIFFRERVLPVLDNVENRLKTWQPAARKQMDDAFARILTAFNVTAISALAGKIPDPQTQRVVLRQSDAAPIGTIIRTARRGYSCNGVLLRPADVIVSSGPASVRMAPCRGLSETEIDDVMEKTMVLEPSRLATPDAPARAQEQPAAGTALSPGTEPPSFKTDSSLPEMDDDISVWLPKE